MPRSVFTQLRARVEDGAVRLTFYLTTPVFESTRGRGKPLAIRIHRKAERRFTFGRNSESYFDGLDATKARVIFEGPLPAVNERKFEYVDRSARLGGTYAYWVSPARAGRPTGPAPVRVRDTQVWWPHAVVEERLTTLAEAYPGLVSLKRYGQTVHGRPIRGAVAGNAENVVASVGTIHAGESGPELLIPALGWLLQEDRGLLQDVGFAVLPSVNIDERERLIQGYPGYLRVNARGVDLNRNFDADWGEVDYGYGLITSDPDSVTYRGPRPPRSETVIGARDPRGGQVPQARAAQSRLLLPRTGQHHRCEIPRAMRGRRGPNVRGRMHGTGKRVHARILPAQKEGQADLRRDARESACLCLQQVRGPSLRPRVGRQS